MRLWHVFKNMKIEQYFETCCQWIEKLTISIAHSTTLYWFQVGQVW